MRIDIRSKFIEQFPSIAKQIDENVEYAFLDENENLGKNIIFLTLGGGYAYGTDIETSDIDIRGISLNTKKELLLCRDHEQTVNDTTDTTIYTTKKILQLLSTCNPNVIEMLGSTERNALYIDLLFDKFILNNKNLFITKNAFFTFGGYARAQLNRLNNKLGRVNDEAERENIMRSIKNTCVHIKERYDLDLDEDMLFSQSAQGFKCIIKDLSKENMASCLNEIASVFKDYAKLGQRNKSAIERNKLNKHAMHLIRLFLMCIDILEKGEVITYREKDHDLLMSIRNNENNKWIQNDSLTEYAEKYVNKLENDMKRAFEESKIPDKPDRKSLENLQIEINEYILSN